MGWFISVFFLISGCITRDITHFYVAGLFAIAGSIAVGFVNMKK